MNHPYLAVLAEIVGFAVLIAILAPRRQRVTRSAPRRIGGAHKGEVVLPRNVIVKLEADVTSYVRAMRKAQSRIHMRRVLPNGDGVKWMYGSASLSIDRTSIPLLWRVTYRSGLDAQRSWLTIARDWTAAMPAVRRKLVRLGYDADAERFLGTAALRGKRRGYLEAMELIDRVERGWRLGARRWGAKR